MVLVTALESREDRERGIDVGANAYLVKSSLDQSNLLEALQRRCHFDEGDVRVVVLEGQPIQTQKQWYRIIDAKSGVIEEGYVNVKDMLTRQPWPEPGDEFPVHPTRHHRDVAHRPQ